MRERNALWYGDSDSEERYALNLIMQNIGDRHKASTYLTVVFQDRERVLLIGL